MITETGDALYAKVQAANADVDRRSRAGSGHSGFVDGR